MSIFLSNADLLKTSAVILLLAGSIFSSFISFWRACALVFLVYLATGGWRFVRLFVLTAPRDVIALYRFLKTKRLLYLVRKRQLSVPKLFVRNAIAHPQRIALRYESQAWTFAQLDSYSNRVANAALSVGLKPGDEVALLMSNRPEYIGIWLGLAKAGIVTALINNQQRAAGLLHSISVINCKMVIFDAEHGQAIKDVMHDLNKQGPIQYFCLDEFDTALIPARSLDYLVEEASTSYPPTLEKTSHNDKLFYIYTSGTTGMPKAAIIKQHRYIWMGGALRNMTGLDGNRYRTIGGDCENIYCCLPLYHLAGGCLGTCQCIVFGDTFSIAHKFSASRFWVDCIQHKCTVAQYIGEICRYLIAQPDRPTDRQHSVTLMFGNGLRPKIWRPFVQRFGISQIGELYGSTEGNANVINTDNREGACGFVSQLLPKLYPVCLIKVDEETNQPVRDKSGMCIRCGPGESGEFVGKIVQSDPTRSFDGYANREATEKKIISNVFQQGDQAFLSGDILTLDDLGYVYFKDRTGDTFRWKGENVSTCEVETVISNAIGQLDCVVFGVDIKDCEGKAGMAVISTAGADLDLDQLASRLNASLPRFAIPVFLRVVNELKMTGTFKMPKNDLQKQGYDFNIIDDPLYYFDGAKVRYVRIDEQIYQDIENGNIKL